MKQFMASHVLGNSDKTWWLLGSRNVGKGVCLLPRVSSGQGRTASCFPAVLAGTKKNPNFPKGVCYLLNNPFYLLNK